MFVGLDRRCLHGRAHAVLAHHLLLGTGRRVIFLPFGRFFSLLPPLTKRARRTDDDPETPSPLASQAIRSFSASVDISRLLFVVCVEVFGFFKLESSRNFIAFFAKTHGTYACRVLSSSPGFTPAYRVLCSPPGFTPRNSSKERSV